MKYLQALLLIFASLFSACAQIPDDRPHCIDKTFDKKVAKTISFTVPTISVEDLKTMQDSAYIFDTRPKEEFDVSHIEGAKCVGFKEFDMEALEGTPRDAPIVVYCSIGYRSEKIGETLQELGYTNVYNLYGSIFEWINQGNPVVDIEGKETTKVHTYNRTWSKWVDENKAERVW